MSNVTNSTVHEHIDYNSPGHDGMLALTVFGVVFGMFLLITSCETMIRMSREGRFFRLPYCYTISANPEATDHDKENIEKKETLV